MDGYDGYEYDYDEWNLDAPPVAPLPGFDTTPEGLRLINESRFDATITTTDGKVTIEHPSRGEIWRRDGRIGRGGAALIFREYHDSGTGPTTQTVRVVKKPVNLTGEVMSTAEEIKSELSLLLFFSRQVDHCHLFTMCQGWFMEDGHIVIAMDSLIGDLDGHIYDSGLLSEREARVVIKQVLAALKFMHEKNITHRDVKLNNIMIATKPTQQHPHIPWSVRLGDFGISQFHADPTVAPEGRINTHGTPDYKAPELFHMVDPEETTLLGFEAKADMWALGVTVYRLLTGVAPYEVSPNDDDPAVLRTICRDGMPQQPAEEVGMSLRAWGFIKRLTSRSALERPTAAEALASSAWLNEQV